MTDLASIQVAADYDLPGIIAAAGGDPTPGVAKFDNGHLYVPGVTQSALAAALASYDHGATVKAQLVGYAASKRYDVETGGITIAGVPIATDDRSKTMIMGARIAAAADSSFTTPWVGSDGSEHTLDAATVIAISNAVLAHVNACFTVFTTVKGEIAAGTITGTPAINAAFEAVTA